MSDEFPKKYYEIKSTGDKFFLYVKQDGMYNTKEILLTDEYKPDDLLPRDWYVMKNASDKTYKTFQEFLMRIYESFMCGIDDTDKLTLIVENEPVVITKEDIKEQNPEYFI